MNIEKFTLDDGTQGYRIKGTFASSRNHNGAYFDPVEVFSVDKAPEKFNFGHKDYETDYSTNTKVVEAPTANIEGKIIKFNWEIVTTNENFVKLIDEDNFGGYSPELKPKIRPIVSELGERFYRAGGLVWENTAILGKDQKPGFVGANEYELEKFEVLEDVVIEQFQEAEPEAEVDTPEPVEDPKDEVKEAFTLEDIKAVVKEVVAEHFQTTTTEPEADKEDKEEEEKFQQAKLETERFNTIAQAKGKIDTVKLIQKGSDSARDGKKESSAVLNTI